MSTESDKVASQDLLGIVKDPKTMFSIKYKEFVIKVL